MIRPAYISKEMADDFEESVRVGAAAGIRTVNIRSKVWGQAVEDLAPAAIEKMKSILQRYEMRVGSIFSPVGKCNIEDEEEVRRHLEIFRKSIPLAKALGTSFIRIFPFRGPGFKEYEPSRLSAYRELIVQRMQPLLELAESNSILITFECVGSTLARTAREIRSVIDAMGNPSCVRVVWEIDVAAKSGESPREGYPFLRGLISDVHVKRNEEGNIDPIDGVEGTYAQAFSLLAGERYNGLATIEHWPGQEGTLRGIAQLQVLLGAL